MSWEQLVEIMHTAKLEQEQRNELPPAACPHDGEPLLQGPDGQLFCPSDGWRPEDDPSWHG